MLGGSTLGIGVTMFLRDQFSGPAARVRASAQQTQAELLKMQTNQLRATRNMYGGMAVAGVMALRGMGRQVKKAAEFGYEMEFVNSITGANVEQQEKLNNIAKRLGRETMFYPQAIAEGMRFMAMAGMEAQEVEKNIQGAVKLAGATKSELGGKGGAADIMTNIMKQFQIGFEHTDMVADRLAYGVTNANTNLFDLGEALKYAGATAMDLNISLDESIAMVMALGNAGMQGSMAGVAMENAMRYMSRAITDFGSGPSKKAIASLGMSMSDFTDERGNLLSMTQIIKNMGKALEGAYAGGGNAEKQAVLQSIFGVRGKRAGSLLIRNLKEFEKFTTDVATNSGGHSSKIMADMMNTLQGAMFRIGSAWQAMWTSFTQKVGPVIMFVLNGVTKVLGFMERIFDTKFFGGFFAVGLAGFLSWKTAVFAYRAVVAGLKVIHNGAKMSALSMSEVTVGGYKRMTAAAAKYAASVKTANMAQMVGMGQVRGLSLNKAGRIVHTSKKTGMKTFVSTENAASLQAGTARMVGGKIVKNSASRLVASRLLGILGGPIGIGLSIVLPGLIGGLIQVIKSQKESTEKNTAAMDQQSRLEVQKNVEYSRMGHMIKFMDTNQPQLKVFGTTVSGRVVGNDNDRLMNAVGQLVEQLKANANQNQVIRVSVDEEAINGKIKDIQTKDMVNALKGL